MSVNIDARKRREQQMAALREQQEQDVKTYKEAGVATQEGPSCLSVFMAGAKMGNVLGSSYLTS